ncbi:BspA family leucine-rich repeat surface protein [Streptomyces sp. MNU77]|uniref:BspA family leucine-rich repeat surface protein n=1 Tax=Streptomyces sp. MNU77 TaxID=1573406 RepID=UPI0015BDC5E3|nr:BspA family leucine-rich repeat surface protein [Streptomyces sp. MNU77]
MAETVQQASRLINSQLSNLDTSHLTATMGQASRLINSQLSNLDTSHLTATMGQASRLINSQLSNLDTSHLTATMGQASRLINSQLSNLDTSHLTATMGQASRLINSQLSNLDTSHLTATMGQASRLINSQLPRIDTSFLDDFLHGTLPWQGLADPMRDTLAGVLDEARTSVEAGEDCDVPEEIVAGLEEQAAQFAASAPALLPPATQKYLFAVFAAASMMMTLMYVSVVSDTANALLDEAYQHGELALILFTAACVAWDRKSGNRRDGVDD